MADIVRTEAPYGKQESYVNAHGVVDDSDVQQVEGRDYDPKHDKRDMKRLGKRQELKVSQVSTPDMSFAPY